MNKKVLVSLTTLLAIIVLSGCNMFAKANGVILYGEKEEVQNAVEKEKGKQKSKLAEEEQHIIKMVTTDNQQLMILSEETAQSLVDKKLITEITNQEKGTTKAISSLPKIATGEGLLFTKDEQVELKIDNINSQFVGNLIIGEARVYADMFLIVKDEEWASLKGTEKTMAIVKYDKDPSAEGLDYDVERTQLIQIQD